MTTAPTASSLRLLGRETFLERLQQAVGSTIPLDSGRLLADQSLGEHDLAVAGMALAGGPEAFSPVAHWTADGLYEQHLAGAVDDATLENTRTRTFQRPFVGNDHDWLIEQLCRRPDHPWLGGRTPSPAGWNELIWRDVALLNTVGRVDTGERIGTIRLVDLDERDRTGQVQFLFEPSVAVQGWPLEALWSFIDRTFEILSLHSVQIELARGHLDRLGGSFGSLFDLWGTLRNHRFIDESRREDVIVCGVNRWLWESRVEQVRSWANR